MKRCGKPVLFRCALYLPANDATPRLSADRFFRLAVCFSCPLESPQMRKPLLLGNVSGNVGFVGS